MSALQKELVAATKVDPKGMTRPAFLDAVLVAVNKLSDKAWGDLSKDAQAWFNDATDIKNANIKSPRSAKPVPDFPDFEEPKAEDEPAPRRRGAAPAEPEPKSEELKVGDNATLTTRRGKQYTGEVIELPEGLIVLKVDGSGEELEFPADGTEVFINEPAGGAADEPAEPEGPAEPQVGDTVAVVTGRGKEYEGEVLEIDEDKDLLVLKVGKEELEFVRATLKSVEITGGSEPEPEPEPTPRRRGGDAAKDEPAARSSRRSSAPVGDNSGKDAAEDEKQKRSSNPRGVSVGGRIRELLADDTGMSVEAVTKALKDEGLAFRDTSVNMIYKDLTQFLSLLKTAKKLK